MQKLLTALFGCLMCLPSGPSHADEVFDAIKFMCREDLHYFELEPMSFANPEDYDALRDSDFYFLYGKAIPLRKDVLRACRLHRHGYLGGPYEFTMHSTWRRGPFAEGGGPCGGGQSEGIELRLNGKTFATFIAGCLGYRSDFVHFSVASGFFEICTSEVDNGKETKISCTRGRLGDWVESPGSFSYDPTSLRQLRQ